MDMICRKALDEFVEFIMEMDNVQAERNELRLLVDPKYWRWSNKRLLKRIRRVGKIILHGVKPEPTEVPVFDDTVAPTAEPPAKPPESESKPESGNSVPAPSKPETTPTADMPDTPP